jgi:prepilin-type N-terminal cleavage/methylation domain-containing protein
MNRPGLRQAESGFTLAELLIAIAIALSILGVTFTSAVALQKSFTAVDNYFGTHMQQIRIVDYLARDVRRGLSVTSSIDPQTVTVKIPKYIIQAGDSDATVSNIGTPRSPSLAIANSDYNINYGTPTSTVTTVVYSVNGSSILRTEDGELTTIASSTDNLIPETADIELANTEYTTTKVTFKPISVADRNGTVVYSTAYLRNRRRPF